MAGKISNAWQLMGASWGILKSDKKLILFPLISGICLLLVQLPFLFPLLKYFNFQHPGQPPVSADAQIASLTPLVQYGLLFLYYYCTYLVIAFFNTGLVACILRRMRGEQGSFNDGIREALSRWYQIAGWALVASSVGLILRAIEDRSSIVGSIVSAILGIAFSIASYFVIPVMVAENMGPIDALKESSKLFRKTWGERLINNLGFSLVFLILLLVGFLGTFVVIAVGASSIGVHQSLPFIVFCGSLLLVYFVTLCLGLSTLQSIFQTALYLYVKTGDAPAGFNSDILGQSFKAKKTR